MNKCTQCQEWAAESFYGDLSDEKKHILEEHLRECEHCAAALSEMSSTLGIMEKRQRPEPDDTFWDGYWDRLAVRMEAEKVFETPFVEKAKRPFFGLGFVPRWAFQAAAAIVLVVVGIFIGRVLYTPGPQGIQTADLAAAQPQAAPGFELAQRTQAYVQRSKLLLLGLVNFDPTEGDLYTLDLPYKQEVSRGLLQEAGWLKQELGNSRQRRMQELVADLEAILLQIANLEAEEDLEAVELVQTGVESRGIFLKIHLADVAGVYKNLESVKPGKPATDRSRRF
jgi:hypothetical protein